MTEEGVSHVDIWEESVAGRGNSHCEGREGTGLQWSCLWKSKGVSAAVGKEGRSEVQEVRGRDTP